MTAHWPLPSLLMVAILSVWSLAKNALVHAAGDLEILVPSADSSYIPGDRIQVSWLAPGRNTSSFGVYLYKEGWFLQTLASSAAAAPGYTNVTLGEVWPSGHDYQIQVIDSGDDPTSAVSDNFTIQGEISLSSPTAGSVVYIHSGNLTVAWSASNLNSNYVRLLLYKGTDLVQSFGREEWNQGSRIVSLDTSLPSGADYQAMVVDTGFNATYGLSGNFSIRGEIVVGLPGESEVYFPGEEILTTWEAAMLESSYVWVGLFKGNTLVQVLSSQVSASSGADYSTLDKSLYGGKNYRVKVVDAGYSPTFDFSENFTIAGSITASRPHEGSVAHPGRSVNVTWSALGLIGDYLHLQLYKGSTLLYSWPGLVLDSLGSVAANLSLTLSSGYDYRIKLIDALDATVYDYSSSFTIHGEIMVGYPNSTSSYLPGDTIRTSWWHSGLNGEDVHVYLYKGALLVQTLELGLSASLGGVSSFLDDWIYGGNDYRVKVVDASFSDAYGFSDYFTVYGEIIVGYPIAALTFHFGEELFTNWTSLGLTGDHVALSLYKGGTLVQVLTSSVEASLGRAQVTLPSANMTGGNNYRVLVADRDDPTGTTAFSANFSVTGGIVVTSPDGSAPLYPGYPVTITWSVYELINDFVRVELYRGNSLVDILEASSSALQGGAAPMLNRSLASGGGYRLKVTDTGSDTYGYSVPFNITRGIEVYSPSAMGLYVAGETLNVSWGVFLEDEAQLSVSLYSGSSWVATLTGSDGVPAAHGWATVELGVPLDLGYEYALVVESLDDPSIHGRSALFTIAGCSRSGQICLNSSVPRTAECLPNFYCPDLDMASMTNCGKGHYCPFESMIEPLPCPVGAFCPEVNMSEPIFCEPGSLCLKEGLSSPILCPAGSYCPDATSQVICDIGTYCPSGASNYTECDGYAYETCPYTNMSEPMDCNTTQTGGPECYYMGANNLMFCEASDVNGTLEYTCICEGLWMQPYCDEQQNLTNSFVAGFLTLFLTLLVMIPCFCFDSVSYTALCVDHAFKNKFKTQLEDILEELQMENKKDEPEKESFFMKIWRGFETKWQGFLALRCTKAVIKRLRPRLQYFIMAITSFWRKFKYFLYMAFFIIMLYIVDLFCTLANVFLIVKTLEHNFTIKWSLDEQMDRVVEAFHEFLEGFGPFGWIANIYWVFVEVCESFDFLSLIFKDLEVTCDGSQAPLQLLANSVIVILITILFESRIHHFLNTTVNNVIKEKKKNLKKQGWPWFLVDAMGSTFDGLIFLFKFFVQLLAGMMTISEFFPFHRWEPKCGMVDMALAILCSIIAWPMMFCCMHILLRTFIWGLPSKYYQDDSKTRLLVSEDAAKYYPSLVQNLCCYLENTHFKRQDSFYENKFEKKNLEKYKGKNVDLCGYLDVLILIFLDLCRGKATTLVRYIQIMVWKVKLLFKMMFGVWNKESVDMFEVKQMAKESEIAYADDGETEALYKSFSGITQSHTLIFQFAPAFVCVAKFAEAVNNPPSIILDESCGECLVKDNRKDVNFMEFQMTDRSSYVYRFLVCIVRFVQFIFVMLMSLNPKSEYLIAYCICAAPLKLIELYTKYAADAKAKKMNTQIKPTPSS